MDQEVEADGDDSIPSTSFQSKKPKKEWSVPVQKSQKKLTIGSAYPKSVPLSSLLKLGKTIPPKCNHDIIELHVEEFYIEEKEWSAPIPVKLSVDKKSRLLVEQSEMPSKLEH